MNQLFEDQRNVHDLYSHSGTKNYIDQVVSYIQDGILAGDYVILIENERVYRAIHNELSTRLTKKQMEFVHFFCKQLRFLLFKRQLSSSCNRWIL
jgi:hypothetical protein